MFNRDRVRGLRMNRIRVCAILVLRIKTGARGFEFARRGKIGRGVVAIKFSFHGLRKILSIWMEY